VVTGVAWVSVFSVAGPRELCCSFGKRRHQAGEKALGFVRRPHIRIGEGDRIDVCGIGIVDAPRPRYELGYVCVGKGRGSLIVFISEAFPGIKARSVGQLMPRRAC
jgi:hypothetical protein